MKVTLYRLLSFHTVWAQSRRSTQTKEAPEGASFNYRLYNYDFFFQSIFMTNNAKT